MDACTVAALDTITAFAVPNLGGHLATPSIFSGLAVAASHLAQPIDQPTLRGRRIIEARSFRPSTVKLQHWLCSSRQLLRGSCRHGRMYRCSSRRDHRFRSSRSRRTSRNAVDFFGSGGSASRLAQPTDQSTSSGRLIIEALSFRPSTMNLRHWLCSSRQLLRESWPAWTHAPSQPLMRSPLSQFQTSADISQRRRFFRVGQLPRVASRNPSFSLLQVGNGLLEPTLFDRRL